MPANRRPVDRQAKRDEIVVAATGLFAGEGFDTTSVAQLAAAVGVTTNTVYWYFADKDAVLVAVLDRLLDEALQEHAQQADLPWHEQALWALQRLQRIHRLVPVVHVRAAVSPTVATWHDAFHALTDALLADGLRRAGVAEDDLAAVSRISTFVVEGLLSHPQSDADSAAAVRLLARLTSPGGT